MPKSQQGGVLGTMCSAESGPGGLELRFRDHVRSLHPLPGGGGGKGHSGGDVYVVGVPRGWTGPGSWV